MRQRPRSRTNAAGTTGSRWSTPAQAWAVVEAAVKLVGAVLLVPADQLLLPLGVLGPRPLGGIHGGRGRPAVLRGPLKGGARVRRALAGLPLGVGAPGLPPRLGRGDPGLLLPV